VRWVREFLQFALSYRREPFEKVLLRYSRYLQGLHYLSPWQVRQAIDAVITYRYQFRASTDASTRPPVVPLDEAAILREFRVMMRLRNLSPRTERSYLAWARRFVRYCRRVGTPWPPSEREVKTFLTHLALQRKVSATTQNQAFSGLLKLFTDVLHVELTDMKKSVRARTGRRLPTVLSIAEVKTLLRCVPARYRLMAKLAYGSGVRCGELVELRIKDLDFDGNALIVKRGKGNKDRVTLLPESIQDELREHLEWVKKAHEHDLRAGLGAVELPGALGRKYPKAAREWAWQYVFPTERFSPDPDNGILRRRHVSVRSYRAAFTKAVEKSGIVKHAKPHTLRHCFATHLLLKGVDIHTIQKLMGHDSIETTTMYFPLADQLRKAPTSPLDHLAEEADSE
jgi:integron integrase